MSLTFETRNGVQSAGLLQLCEYVKNIVGNSLTIVELGSYCGSSAKILANYFPNSIIHCVDPWEKYIEDCSRYDINRQELELIEAEIIFDNMKKNYVNIIKNKTNSLEFSKTIPDKSVDFLYIDANHQYSSVKEDILAWKPKIKTGCILAGHDFSWPSVQMAINECFDRPPDANFIDSSWCYVMDK